jgi:hypothetical protein
MSAPRVRTVDQFTGDVSEAAEFCRERDTRAELEIRCMELEQENADLKAELAQAKRRRNGW